MFSVCSNFECHFLEAFWDIISKHFQYKNYHRYENFFPFLKLSFLEALRQNLEKVPLEEFPYLWILFLFSKMPFLEPFWDKIWRNSKYKNSHTSYEKIFFSFFKCPILEVFRHKIWRKSEHKNSHTNKNFVHFCKYQFLDAFREKICKNFK